MDYNQIAPNLCLGEKPITFEGLYIRFQVSIPYTNLTTQDEFSKKHLNHLMGSHKEIAELKDKIKSLTWYQTPLNDELPTGAV